jgi:hypothetical protein
MVKSSSQEASVDGWGTMSRSLTLAAVDRCLSVSDSPDNVALIRQLEQIPLEFTHSPRA